MDTTTNPNTPTIGAWVHYHGTLTHRLNGIYRITHLNSDWLTINDGIWPPIRCRAQSVTICHTGCRTCAAITERTR